jgi:hypothetical protein
MGAIDDLPKRNSIYQGTFQGLHFDELADKFDKLRKDGDGEYIGRNHECAALPQFLTAVGYTGRWHPGPRVIDLDFLLPGTVIANFKLVDGRLKYPNQHGWHVGLFDKFWRGAMMVNGLPCEFSMFDQYAGKPASRRGVAILTPEWKKAHPDKATPANDASEYFVVVTP